MPKRENEDDLSINNKKLKIDDPLQELRNLMSNWLSNCLKNETLYSLEVIIKDIEKTINNNKDAIKNNYKIEEDFKGLKNIIDHFKTLQERKKFLLNIIYIKI